MKAMNDAKLLLDKLSKPIKGNHGHRLSADQVREAREVWRLAHDETGYAPRGLLVRMAEHYGVSYQTIDGAVRGSTYRWVK